MKIKARWRRLCKLFNKSRKLKYGHLKMNRIFRDTYKPHLDKLIPKSEWLNRLDSES